MAANKKLALSAYNRAYRLNNKVAVAEGNRRWREKNREKMAAYLKQYLECKKCDPAFVLREAERKKKFRRENLEMMRARARAYHKLHPEHARASVLRRKARLINAVHPDHDFAAERELHRLALWATRATGEPWEVDHVIPLSRGGWHHHLNMQLLTKRANREKRDNPFWEWPGFCSFRDVPKHLWPASLAEEYERRLAA